MNALTLNLSQAEPAEKKQAILTKLAAIYWTGWVKFATNFAPWGPTR